MWLSRFAWTAWALLPVIGLTYHFGPGQRAYQEDQAARIVAKARTLEDAARAAQEEAYALHLAGMKARRAAFASQSPEDAATARDAGDQELAAYTKAADAWKSVAETLGQAQDALAKDSTDTLRRVRLAKARAQVRSGQVNTGVSELEDLMDSLEEDATSNTAPQAASKTNADFAHHVREELATGYYYNARLMRLAGAKSEDWREVSGKARQNFRYLAESATTQGRDQDAANHQKNVELVLNLEQSSLQELQAKPLPKNSPRAGRDGDRPGNRAGKSKRPPRKGDARGAGGAGDIGPGW